MATLCGSSVRVSWISCLLISSITCLPAPKGYGSFNPDPESRDFTGWTATSGSNYPGAGRLDRSASLPRVPEGFWFQGEDSLGPQATGSLSSGYVPSAGSGYDDSGYYSNVGFGSVGTGLYYSNSGSADIAGEFSSEGDEEEGPESFFSDVSDLDPVSSYRSHSSYQRGKAMSAQISYSPQESPLPSGFQRSPEQPFKGHIHFQM